MSDETTLVPGGFDPITTGLIPPDRVFEARWTRGSGVRLVESEGNAETVYYVDIWTGELFHREGFRSWEGASQRYLELIEDMPLPPKGDAQ